MFRTQDKGYFGMNGDTQWDQNYLGAILKQRLLKGGGGGVIKSGKWADIVYGPLLLSKN